MDTIAVFVDDAAYAARLLSPMIGPSTQWVLVACAPRLTHRIGKWVSHRNREQWRRRWADKLFAELAPTLPAGTTLDKLVAKSPLTEVVARLRTRHGAALRVLDARRPKLGQAMEPLSPEHQADGAWTVPIAVSSGLSVVLALSD
jgi:hypothetical protein